MEHTTWPPHQNPPQPPQQAQSQLYPHHQNQYSQFYPPQPQNPNPSPYYVVENPTAAVPSSYTFSHQQLRAASYDPHSAAAAVAAAAVSSSGYYSDYALNAAGAGYAALTDITIPSTETVQFAAGYPNSIAWNNQSFVPQKIGTWKKGQTKTKIVQSAYCEVCKVDCNSKDVLEQHKLGKKHKKNLEKLNAITVPVPAPASALGATAGSNIPIIGPLENPQKAKPAEVQKSKKKRALGVEDLETKRRKVVEGGAAVEAVRTCVICNVVCNSDTVYSYHLAGQKHASMVKKRAAGRMAMA